MSAHGLDPGDPATHGRGSLGELADAGSTRSTRLRDETSCLAGEESMPRYERVPCNHSTWDAWSMLDARSMSCCKEFVAPSIPYRHDARCKPLVVTNAGIPTDHPGVRDGGGPHWYGGGDSRRLHALV